MCVLLRGVVNFAGWCVDEWWEGVASCLSRYHEALTACKPCIKIRIILVDVEFTKLFIRLLYTYFVVYFWTPSLALLHHHYRWNHNQIQSFIFVWCSNMLCLFNNWHRLSFGKKLPSVSVRFSNFSEKGEGLRTTKIYCWDMKCCYEVIFLSLKKKRISRTQFSWENELTIFSVTVSFKSLLRWEVYYFQLTFFPWIAITE